MGIFQSSKVGERLWAERLSDMLVCQAQNEKETVWLKLPDAAFSRGGILGILRLPPHRAKSVRVGGPGLALSPPFAKLRGPAGGAQDDRLETVSMKTMPPIKTDEAEQ